jgi:hypothetical protein
LLLDEEDLEEELDLLPEEDLDAPAFPLGIVHLYVSAATTASYCLTGTTNQTAMFKRAWEVFPHCFRPTTLLF